MERTQRNNVIVYGLCFALLLFCECFFFRNVIGNSGLISDTGDGRLTMLITEHWFHVLKGESPITELGMFYPAKHTLAFSDMFLGFGAVHSVYRILGMNVFRAYKWTLMTVHLLGTVSCFYLLKKILKLDHFWALFGTMAFSFSNSYATVIGHTQLAAVSVVPLAAIFVIAFFQNLSYRGRRNACAYLAIVTLVGIMYTAWYIAFFSALFAVIALIVWAIVLHKNGKPVLREIKAFIGTVRFDLLGYIIALIALCAPFLYLELEVMKTNGGGWNYWGVAHYMPELIDIVNVSTGNWALGGLMEAFQLSSRNIASGEVSTGFTLILLGLFIAFTVLTFRGKKKTEDPEKHKQLMFCEIFSVSVIVGIILSIRLSSNGVSLWWLVNSFFPGGSSIRAVGRILLFLSLPMAVVTAAMGNYLTESGVFKGKKRIPIQCVVLGLVFILNIRTNGVNSGWNAWDQMKYLASVAAPPEDCETMYIVNCDKSHQQGGPYAQMDAYAIADHFKINTINGYSGMRPEGWDGIDNINSEEYESAVSKWIMDHQLQNVYSYDATENTWTRFDVLTIADPCFCAADKQIPDLMYGLWDMNPSGDFSWTKQDFEVTLRDDNITKNGLLLKVNTFFYDEYLKQQPGGDLDYSIYVNGKLIEVLQATGEYNEYRFDVPAAENDLYDIKIKSVFYFNPSDLGISSDTRDLSLALYYLGADENP